MQASDPRGPAATQCIPRLVLDRHVREHADRRFVQFQDGTDWNYGDFRGRVRRAAAGLQKLGVQQGQHVVCWLPNGPEMLTLWFAINYIGAVYVPINVAYRGRVLELALDLADGALLVAHEKLIDRLDPSVSLPPTRIMVGTGEAVAKGWTHSEELFETTSELEPLTRDIMPWDVQSIVFTSGTTGASKGVLQTYLQQYVIAQGAGFLAADDHYLMTLPLYHQGGITGITRMFFRGASVAMVDGFSTSSFWRVVDETGATGATLMGTMASFLLQAPASANDRRHSLRHVILSPLENHHVFAERFGVDVYSVYNMTELGAPLETVANPSVTGTCGRARPGFELRIVDENDCELPEGAAGELIVRTDIPWVSTVGYHKNPEATVRAWRNGWFHTGDRFSRDAEGNYFFRDRLRDAIRRRGENVSAYEVEAEIAAHPAVREVAVVAVPSPLGEDDILAVLAPAPGHLIDPAALIESLRGRLAHFMIPRYVRVIDELPKTPSQKVQKQVLRDQGVTEQTWDRERAGIKVGREKF